MRFCYQPHTIIGIQEHPAENLPLKNRPSIVSYIADPSEIANPFGGGAAMKTSIALKIFRVYQSSNLKPSAVRGYKYLTDNFEALFGEKDLNSIYSEDTYHFSEIIMENSSKSTKRHRYSQLKAFFNFVISNYQPDLKNPLDSPFMRKTFHLPKPRQRRIISTVVIDEVILRSQSLQDKLILELQSRCSARIGEVLNIRVRYRRKKDHRTQPKERKGEGGHFHAGASRR